MQNFLVVCFLSRTHHCREMTKPPFVRKNPRFLNGEPKEKKNLIVELYIENLPGQRGDFKSVTGEKGKA